MPLSDRCAHAKGGSPCYIAFPQVTAAIATADAKALPILTGHSVDDRPFLDGYFADIKRHLPRDSAIGANFFTFYKQSLNVSHVIDAALYPELQRTLGLREFLVKMGVETQETGTYTENEFITARTIPTQSKMKARAYIPPPPPFSPSRDGSLKRTRSIMTSTHSTSSL